MKERRRIFIVEDDPSIVKAVSFALEGLQIEIQSTDRLEGAVEAIQAFTPDLVILDLVLPDGYGMRVLKILREGAATVHLPILVLTALDGRQTMQNGLESGANAYITKPFEMTALRAAVKQLLSQAT